MNGVRKGSLFLCTALCAGEDTRGTPVGKNHRCMLIRVSLPPAHEGPGPFEDTLHIERVLSTGPDGGYHFVTPIAETYSPSRSS